MAPLAWPFRTFGLVMVGYVAGILALCGGWLLAPAIVLMATAGWLAGSWAFEAEQTEADLEHAEERIYLQG